MLRFVNICLVLGLVSLAYVIYQVKYEARSLDEQIALLHKEIEQERDGLAVARAEWSLLNRPERIQRLAKKYLKLNPANPQQLVILDEVTESDLVRAGKVTPSDRAAASGEAAASDWTALVTRTNATGAVVPLR